MRVTAWCFSSAFSQWGRSHARSLTILQNRENLRNWMVERSGFERPSDFTIVGKPPKNVKQTLPLVEVPFAVNDD
jgi:hypothetical protein